jgi:hydrogenase-4 component B
VERRVSDGASTLPAWLVVVAAVLLGASGVPGLFLARRVGAGEKVATALVAAAAALGLVGTWLAAEAPCTPMLALPWSIPGAGFVVAVDAISALFLAPIFFVGLLGAFYGLAYWPERAHEDGGRRLRLVYGLLTGALVVVAVARNAVLFLAAWELMALAAFLAITTEDEKPEVRAAGLLYLVLTHAATLALFAMFTLLRSATGTYDLAIAPGDVTDPRAATAILLLAVFGFGLKAGLMPMHVWLPSAHGNAPSHVSALMSGVLIKTGIYGLVRVTSFFATPPTWWGVLVLAAGGLSAVLGVAYAIGQHDIKRLLAYHSVENIGIIAMGLGLALLGRSFGRPELVALGLGGALLHVWNHGLFKSLLFFAAGSAIHATGTRSIDRMGGLARRMPYTALAFLAGAVAICGLPPLNGFVSEYLVYVGFLRSTEARGGDGWLAGAMGAPALALVGALALACFVKVFGAAFLGEPRTTDARRAHESPRPMLAPMGALVAACAAIGLLPPLVAPLLDRAAAAWAPELTPLPTLASLTSLDKVGVASAATLAVAALLALALRRAARARGTAAAPTWDCGYAAPSPRMQYTASSFAESLVALFAWALRPRRHAPHLEAAPFPAASRYESHVDDVVLDGALVPAARLVGRGMHWFRWIQRGSPHLYVLFIVVALVAALLAARGTQP